MYLEFQNTKQKLQEKFPILIAFKYASINRKKCERGIEYSEKRAKKSIDQILKSENTSSTCLICTILDFVITK